MSRSHIEVTTKPRLIKRGDTWMCVGLSKKHWWHGQKVITQYGQTAAAAFEGWEYFVNREFFQ